MANVVTVSGPIFDSRAEHYVREFDDLALRTVAHRGLADVAHILDVVIRHPTPYYETQIRVTDEPPDMKSINDAGVIYGHWLEGTGSRNKTTRFKGYHAFRRAAQQLQSEVPRLVEYATRRLVAKLNGH